MNTNFHFLNNEFPTLSDRTQKAEKLVITDPRTSLIYCRMALEEAVNYMYANDEELETQFDTSLHNLLVQPEFKAQFNHKLYNELFIIKKAGNLAVHNKNVSDVDAHNAIEAMFYFSKWFAKSYAKNEIESIGLFNFNLIPKEGGVTLSRKEIEDLQEKLNRDLDKYQEELKEKDKEQKKLAKENELYKKQIELLQSQIEQNKKEANKEDQEEHPRNETDTRKYLIDVALREAGWDLQGANDKEFKVTNMPTSTNTSGTGYVDYVLWGDDGLPLALVEAKSTLQNATKGENQAQLYADALEQMYGRRPVMYYTNGYQTYLWDDQFYKQARLVHGFYTKAELETLMYRRANRRDIRTAEIDADIAGRFYQMRSIRSIANHFAGNDKHSGKLIGTNRAALLVLATGTGKTRTSIALSKVLLECNWAKRILFLADRTSLVKQAKRNFVKHLPEHTSVNLLEDKDNPDARFAFSTYQTMMNLIDGSRDKEKRFYGVGHFDLIIIDEAHRSIYKKYQAIFEYFDALFLGLTATPIDRIDKNTYHIFGLPDKSPTDAFTFQEAIDHNPRFLNPYKSIEVPTKFTKEGIKYEDLSEEEKEQFEDEILDGDKATGNEWIPPAELNKWLFNKPTTLKTLKFILEQGIKKRGGEELGKTIVFAKNRKHAQFLKDMFLELDKELFGNDYVKVITHGEEKAQEFIDRFCDEEKERLPQIAISVDMMDTGIDAPSCVNLVFYKPVKSYAKFWQMIGRGSRLRPNLFGDGKDKTKFLIFDLCGNFEFFRENPEGINPSTQKSLTEVLFCLKLKLAEYLRSNQFKDNSELLEYRATLLEELYNDVATLDLNRFDVKMKLEIIKDFTGENQGVWKSLSKKNINILEKEIASLIKPKQGENDLARFYDKLLYDLIIKQLETPNNAEFMSAFAKSIAKVVNTSNKLLKKTAIPEIKAKEHVLKLPTEEAFWNNDGIAHLENLRLEVRELVKYLDPVDQKYVTEYENPFKNNIKRLEKLINDNQNNVTIKRIRNGEAITKEELNGLEKILFSETLNKEELEKELGNKLSLTEFVISLLGISEEKVNAAFAQFINDNELNPSQIEFLNVIKQFLTVNGKIDPKKLYESPFKEFHALGVDGVFTEQQADKIFKIVENFNQAN